MQALFPAGSIDDSQERSHRDARWTFRSIGLGVVAPGRPGDIEMRPRNPVRKLLEESRRRYRPGLAATDILDVRNVRLDLFRVFLVERQLPELLAHFPARRDDLVDQFLIGSQHCCVHVTQRD